MSSLFGYYGLGLRALDAARQGLQVSGDNISNINTPGYARRRLDLGTGIPIREKGGYLDQGVEILRIRRVEDRFLQSTLQRESGSLAYSNERLRGLSDTELIYGTLEGESILTAYGNFSEAFTTLASNTTDAAARDSAVAAADSLATKFRDTYGRLASQRRNEDRAVVDRVSEVNQLANQLADLNVQISGLEADGSVASPLRDQRQLVVERLSELTGGIPATAENGKVLFQFQGGPTLVTAERAVELNISTDADGLARLSLGSGPDITDRLRQGELGGLLSVRDDTIPAKQVDLDQLASDLITRANLITTSTFDLDGTPGGPLFVPDPPSATGAARTIAVSTTIKNDPSRLAISADGTPGNNAGAIELAALFERQAPGLGWKSPAEFLSESITRLGNEIVQEDVNFSVSAELVNNLTTRRDEVSGVSLDEEAVELIKNQRAFEAAARFMQVINEVTEIAVNIG